MNPVFPSMILCEWQEHKGAYLLLCTPTTLLYACAYKLQQHIVLLKLCRAPRWKPLPLSSCSPEFAQNTLKYIEAWLLLQNSFVLWGFDLFPARFDPQSRGHLMVTFVQEKDKAVASATTIRGAVFSVVIHQPSTTCESDKTKSILHHQHFSRFEQRSTNERY